MSTQTIPAATTTPSSVQANGDRDVVISGIFLLDGHLTASVTLPQVTPATISPPRKQCPAPQRECSRKEAAWSQPVGETGTRSTRGRVSSSSMANNIAACTLTLVQPLPTSCQPGDASLQRMRVWPERWLHMLHSTSQGTGSLHYLPGGSSCIACEAIFLPVMAARLRPRRTSGRNPMTSTARGCMLTQTSCICYSP